MRLICHDEATLQSLYQCHKPDMLHWVHIYPFDVRYVPGGFLTLDCAKFWQKQINNKIIICDLEYEKVTSPQINHFEICNKIAKKLKARRIPFFLLNYIEGYVTFHLKPSLSLCRLQNRRNNREKRNRRSIKN